MSVRVTIEYKYRIKNVLARFTKRVWYNAVRESLLKAEFGDTGHKIARPIEVVTTQGKVLVNSYAWITVYLGKISFKEKFLVSDNLVDIVDKNVDMVIGYEAISRNHIRVFEEY